MKTINLNNISKKQIKIIFLFLFVFGFSTLNAATYYLRTATTGTRNWTDSATWSSTSSSGAALSSGFPIAGDDVIYDGSSTTAINLNITVDVACASFTNTNTGNNSSITITIASGKKLTINGDFAITGVANISKTISLLGTGLVEVNGDINIGTALITPTTTGSFTKMNFYGPNITLQGNLNMYSISLSASASQGSFVSHSNGKFTLAGTGAKGYMNSYQPAAGLSANNRYTFEPGSPIVEFYHVTDCPIYAEQGITTGPLFSEVGSSVIYNGSGAASIVFANTYYNLILNNPAGYTLNGNITIGSQLNLLAGNLNIAGNTFSMNANTQLNISGGNGVTGDSNRFRYSGNVDVTYSGSVTKAGIELRTGTAFTGLGTAPTRLNNLTITGTTNFNLGTTVGRNSVNTTATSLWVISSVSINDANFTCNMPNIYTPNFTVAGGSSTINSNLLNVENLTINGLTTLTKSISITNNLSLGNNLTNSSFITTKNLVTTSNATLNSSGGTGTILVTDVLSVNSGAVLTTGGEIVLYSDESTTARVSAVAAGAILGDVTVQRYLTNNDRTWRLLTAPVKGATNNSIYYNWQNDGNDDGLTGTDVWGTGTGYSPASNGMYYLPISTHNFRKHNSDTGTWTSITNTLTEPLFSSTKNNAFLTFIIYPSGDGVSGNGGTGIPGSLNTTLIAKGNLLTGTQTYTVNAGKYLLIGNPYASPVSMRSLIESVGVNTNTVEEKIWIIDPNIGDFGGYVTWDPVNEYNAEEAESALYGNINIQSGQAFFVKGKTSQASTTFTINESFKGTDSNTAIFGRNSNTTYERLRVNLDKIENSTNKYKDGCVVAFYEGASNSFDQKDVEKFTNPNETLSFLNGTTTLSSEHRAPIADADELFVKLTRAVAGNYKLRVKTENFTFSGSAYFHDLKLGTIIALPLDGSEFQYPFEVTSDPTTQNERFKIVFSTTLHNNDNNLLDVVIYPNPTSKSEGLTINLGKLEIGTYTYRIVNMLGQEIQKGPITNNQYNQEFKINFSTSVNSGLYIMELQNETQTIKTLKILIK